MNMMENSDTKVSADGIISLVWSAWEGIGLTVTNFWKNDDQMVTIPQHTNIKKEIGTQHRALANIYNSPSINLQVPSESDTNPGYISSTGPSSKASLLPQDPGPINSNNVQQTNGQPLNDHQFRSVKRRPYWNDTLVPPHSPTTTHRFQDSEGQMIEPAYGEWMLDPSNPFNELEEYTTGVAYYDQPTIQKNCSAPQDICTRPLQINNVTSFKSPITTTNQAIDTETYENDHAHNPIPFINDQSSIVQEQSTNQPYLPLDLAWIQSMMPN